MASSDEREPGVIRDLQAEIDQFQSGLNDIRPMAVDFFKSLREDGLESMDAAIMTMCYVPGPTPPWKDNIGENAD